MFRLYPNHNQATFNIVRELHRNLEDFGLRRPIGLFEHLDLGPRINRSETEDAYHATLEIPGIDRDDISVTVEKNILTITGQRSRNVPEGFEVIRQERNAMAFQRRLNLPENVAQEAINASFENGILKVDLPKKAEEKPRTIKITAKIAEEK